MCLPFLLSVLTLCRQYLEIYLLDHVASPPVHFLFKSLVKPINPGLVVLDHSHVAMM